MHCPHCQASLSPSAHFCSACGHKIQKNPSQTQNSEKDTPPSPQSPPSSAPPKSSASSKFFIVLAIFAAIGLGYTFEFPLNSKHKNSEQTQIQDNNQEESSLATFEELDDQANSETLEIADEKEVLSKEAPSSTATTNSTPAESSPTKNAPSNETQPKELTRSIENQLKALQHQEVKKAYEDFTSKDFKTTTSLTAFEEFVKSFPVLSNYQSYSIVEASEEGDKGFAIVSLTQKQGKDVVLEYLLALEDRQWKVQGFRVEEGEALATNATREEAASSTTDETPKTAEEKAESSKAVIKVVEGQLEQLKAHEISKAYNDYTSPEFRQATNNAAFEEFVKKYSILTDYKTIKYGDVNFEKNRASVVAILQTADTSNPVEFTLIKKDQEWKVYGFRVLIVDQKPLTATDKGEIQTTINDQLAALKAHQIDKAYSFVSNEFKKATPLEGFKTFLKYYTIFEDYKSISSSTPTQDLQTVQVMVTLTSPDASADVDYRLIKEDNQWRVWSINVVHSTTTVAKPVSIKTADLVQVVEAQLKAIKEHNLDKAYNDFTSKAFKESTSKEAFEQFVTKNPVVSKNQSVNLNNMSFENEVGSLEGTLTSTDQETEPVKYRLVYEDNGWKILSINIVYPLAVPAQPFEITKTEIGTEADAKGTITHPITKLSADETQKKLTVNVYLHNGVKGSTLEVALEHVDTASRVAPVTATLDRDGDAMVSFVFTPPSKGWPKGNYKLYISSSSGVQNSMNFSVE